MGPNIRKLIATKMATDAIPRGEGFEAGIRFLSTKESIITGAKQATEWVQAAITVVRKAAEPNPFKAATDEEIAGEILRKLEERKH